MHSSPRRPVDITALEVHQKGLGLYIVLDGSRRFDSCAPDDIPVAPKGRRRTPPRCALTPCPSTSEGTASSAVVGWESAPCTRREKNTDVDSWMVTGRRVHFCTSAHISAREKRGGSHPGRLGAMRESHNGYALHCGSHPGRLGAMRESHQ